FGTVVFFGRLNAIRPAVSAITAMTPSAVSAAITQPEVRRRRAWPTRAAGMVRVAPVVARSAWVAAASSGRITGSACTGRPEDARRQAAPHSPGDSARVGGLL